jgi:hypothetical protein
MEPTISSRGAACLTALAAAALAATAGCDQRIAGGPGDLSPGIVIQQSHPDELQDQTTKAVASAPPKTMKGGGLVGVLGGARVRLLKAGTHEVLLPLPQLTETQIPVCYAIITTPREAGQAYRVRNRAGSTAMVSIDLRGSRDQEVQIDWSSVILISDGPSPPERRLPDLYLRETSCVQSGAGQVRNLAATLWPANGKIDGYAATIQEFIRGMQQQKPPRSMDALGILESGGNWICTANANLAVALLRSTRVPARSVAVIPPTAQRLEMHRIVEYYDGGQWQAFDPSSLQKDIPMKPWQNIVMARTTIADEDVAMKPRRGTSLGCPYGQELEVLRGTLTLWGRDFFWTMGKPLAEFAASDEAIKLARTEWGSFLASGRLSQRQVNAASASNSAAFLEALRTK